MPADKIHTTNYYNTLIEVSEDTKAESAKEPTTQGDKRTVAVCQYELISKKPYQLTSDDVIFQVFAERKDLSASEYKAAREAFFSKGQACLRTSPLAKSYGYGIHCNKEGKIALYGMETEEYQKLMNDSSVKKVKAMKGKKR